MTRMACALVLVALGLLLLMLFRTDGQTAIGFTFVGAPALAAAIGVHLLAARRRGAVGEETAERSMD